MNIAFGNGNVQIINPEGGSCMKYIQDVFEAERIDERINNLRAKKKVERVLFAFWLSLSLLPLILFFFSPFILSLFNLKAWNIPENIPEWLWGIFFLTIMFGLLITDAYSDKTEIRYLENTLQLLYEGIKDPRSRCADKKEALLFLQAKWKELKDAIKLI